MGVETLLGEPMRAVTVCLFLSAMSLVGSARAELYYLIVGGLGGELRYAERFEAQAESLAPTACLTVSPTMHATVPEHDQLTGDIVRTAHKAIARLFQLP